MASPVKAFIDPSGIYNNTDSLAKLIPNVYVPTTYIVVAMGQSELFVPRYSLVTTNGGTIPIYSNGAPTPTDLNKGTGYSLVTFSPIYTERNATATRGTVGQVYPTGV